MSLTEPVSLDQIKGMLRGVELFEVLASGDLDRVVDAGSVSVLGRGDMLFKSRDPSDRIHVVIEGAIEILRTTPDHPDPVPVAYISPGEVIGDMALLTGSQRRSGGRVPQKAVVWTLTRETFERLANDIPGYGMEIAKMFARRLEGFITHMRRQARRKELAGKLRYFDMPTVVQTLVSSNQTGILTIADEDGEAFAEVLLCDGSIDRARCGALEGEDAFYEIFLGSGDGTFTFQTVAQPDPDTISKTPLTLTAMNLLMEAMRLVDELPEVQGRLPDVMKPYKAQVRHRKLDWDEDSTRAVAKQMLAKLRSPKRLCELNGDLRCSTFTLYDVAARLFETGQIA